MILLVLILGLFLIFVSGAFTAATLVVALQAIDDVRPYLGAAVTAGILGVTCVVYYLTKDIA
jgi:hypothetical protein